MLKDSLTSIELARETDRNYLEKEIEKAEVLQQKEIQAANKAILIQYFLITISIVILFLAAIFVGKRILPSRFVKGS